MNCKLRALGLALFAALVLSGVVAASASAVTHDFEVSETATPTVKAVTPQIYKAVTGSEDQVSCAEVSLTGHLEKGISTSMTATPQFSGCLVKKADPKSPQR